MTWQHSTLASGRWQTLSLAEQLGNIGSEVSRTKNWQNKNPATAAKASERALELLDLTINDKRWYTGLKELTRLREIFCDTIFNEGQEYQSSLTDLEKYFFPFTLLARSKF